MNFFFFTGSRINTLQIKIQSCNFYYSGSPTRWGPWGRALSAHRIKMELPFTTFRGVPSRAHAYDHAVVMITIFSLIPFAELSVGGEGTRGEISSITVWTSQSQRTRLPETGRLRDAHKKSTGPHSFANDERMRVDVSPGSRSGPRPLRPVAAFCFHVRVAYACWLARTRSPPPRVRACRARSVPAKSCHGYTGLARLTYVSSSGARADTTFCEATSKTYFTNNDRSHL
jgi:hypothetical protein